MTTAPAATDAAGAARRAVEAVWRIESGRLIAALARVTGDVGMAEELAQDALVAALEQWPESGVPRNPGAWLTTVAKRRAVDQWRRQAAFGQRAAALAEELRTADAAAEVAAAASGVAPSAAASTAMAGAPLAVQTLARQHRAGLDELLVVAAHRVQGLFLRSVGHGVALVGLQQHHELHGRSLSLGERQNRLIPRRRTSGAQIDTASEISQKSF